MQIYINGESKQVDDNSSLAEVIRKLDLPITRIAIELNRAVVRRAYWETTLVREGDRLEIVHFVGGGGRPEQFPSVSTASLN